MDFGFLILDWEREGGTLGRTYCTDLMVVVECPERVSLAPYLLSSL